MKRCTDVAQRFLAIAGTEGTSVQALHLQSCWTQRSMLHKQWNTIGALATVLLLLTGLQVSLVRPFDMPVHSAFGCSTGYLNLSIVLNIR